MKKQRMFFPVVILICGLAWGKEQEENVHALPDIMVKGEAVSEERQPVSLATFTAEDFKNLYIQRPEEILREVPGAYTGDYNQGGVANTFMIRGFGAGGHGGDAAVFIDGIPLNESGSHADGYADMNVIIPLEIDQVSVYKGPSSALFGNFARGGTLAFSTKKGGEYSAAQLEYGAFGTLNTQVAFGLKLHDRISNNTAVQYFHSKGYQDNSRWLRGNASTRFTFSPTDKMDFAVSARAHGSDWDSPGFIPQEQFENDDPFAQAKNAEDDGGEKTFYTGRFDFGYTITKQLRVLYWLYATQQDFRRYAKFGYAVDGQTERFYDRAILGTGASLNYDGIVGNFPLGVVGGLEFLNESTIMKVWDTKNRVRNTVLPKEDRVFGVNTFSAFVQADLELSQYFRPMLGIRVDDFGGEYENNDVPTSSSTKEMNDYTAVSPKIGFSTQIVSALDFRFNYSKGFQLPNDVAKYDTAYALDPVDLRQWETGLDLDLNDVVTADLTGFILDTDNEIRETIPGSGEYENLGNTRRMGVELGLAVTPITGLEFYGNAAALASEVLENPDAAVVGKSVIGVPEYIGGVGLRYTHSSGKGIGVHYRVVGNSYINEGNTEELEGYGLLNAEIFHVFKGKSESEYRVFFSMKNITDELYSQSAWDGYGTINYAVGTPRSFSVGIQMDW